MQYRESVFFCFSPEQPISGQSVRSAHARKEYKLILVIYKRASPSLRATQVPKFWFRLRFFVFVFLSEIYVRYFCQFLFFFSFIVTFKVILLEVYATNDIQTCLTMKVIYPDHTGLPTTSEP